MRKMQSAEVVILTNFEQTQLLPSHLKQNIPAVMSSKWYCSERKNLWNCKEKIPPPWLALFDKKATWVQSPTSPKCYSSSFSNGEIFRKMRIDQYNHAEYISEYNSSIQLRSCCRNDSLSFWRRNGEGTLLSHDTRASKCGIRNIESTIRVCFEWSHQRCLVPESMIPYQSWPKMHTKA
jgi:hypothetical protein